MAFNFRKIILFFFCITTIDNEVKGSKIPEGATIYDSEILQGLETFIQPALNILKKKHKKSTQIQIFLIHENVSNAFATPEHFLCVLTGLFVYLDSAEELIGILMHELGHLHGQHCAVTTAVLERSQNQALGSLIGGALMSVVTGNPGALMLGASLANIMGHSNFTVFSRSQESMADQFAFRMLEQLNWPIDGIMHFFEKYKHMDQFIQKNFPSYFSTHPYFANRLTSAKNYKINQKNKGAPALPSEFHDIFQKMKVKVICMIKDAAFAEQFLQANPFPEHVKLYGRILIAMRQDKMKESLALSDRLLQIHPSEFLHELRAEILKTQKQFEKAFDEIQKACQKQPKNILFLLKRADLQIHLNKNLEKLAIELERCIETSDTQFKDLLAHQWDLLGKTYHHLGKIGRMRACLAEKFFHIKNINPKASDDARMHAQEALKTLPASDFKFRKRVEEILRQLDAEKTKPIF